MLSQIQPTAITRVLYFYIIAVILFATYVVGCFSKISIHIVAEANTQNYDIYVDIC